MLVGVTDHCENDGNLLSLGWAEGKTVSLTSATSRSVLAAIAGRSNTAREPSILAATITLSSGHTPGRQFGS